MINILVVEDDIIQRQNLIKILGSVSHELNIYEADSKKSALKIASEVEISFMFVDIMLRSSTGIEFAKELRQIPGYRLTWIIFLTTHVDYMLQAFKEIHCYDYILKPYRKDKIIEITKLLLANKYENESHKDKKDHIVFELQGVTYKLYTDDIIFIEVKLRTCMVHTKQKTYMLNRMPLKKLLEMITVDYIIQTHKSFAVNIHYIDQIKKISRGCWEIYFHDYEEQALLAATYKESLKDKLVDS